MDFPYNTKCKYTLSSVCVRPRSQSIAPPLLSPMPFSSLQRKDNSKSQIHILFASGSYVILSSNAELCAGSVLPL